jgi:metal-responsive CopG/Arc/MetJ family transcriptional regulator
MTRIGRPRIGDEPQETRSVSMDGETWKRVDRAAQEDGTTRSAVIRQAVTEHLDKRDQGRDAE